MLCCCSQKRHDISNFIKIGLFCAFSLPGITRDNFEQLFHKFVTVFMQQMLYVTVPLFPSLASSLLAK